MSPDPTPMEPLVAVEDVHTYYGKSHILHGVSLHVDRGEVVGLLGRNGVGKSTTLKTIMGLVYPNRGKVLFAGKPITGLPAHKLARLGIGYVPEDRRIFRLLTVMENLRTGLDRHGVTEGRGDSAGGAERAAHARGQPACLHHGERRNAASLRSVRAQDRRRGRPSVSGGVA